MSAPKWMFIFFLQILSSPYVLTSSTPPPPSPNDVTITASSTSLYEGYTEDLSLNCSFLHIPSSEISGVMSVIVSKTADPDNTTFKEIAILTMMSPIEIIDALGGNVTGALITDGNSYIAYQWSYPSKDVAGRYQCSVYGMDDHGHPVSHNSTSLVIESVDLTMLLNKLQTLENNQEIFISNINKTSTELEKTKTQLNETKTQLNVTTSELDITKEQLQNTSVTLTQSNATLGQMTAAFDRFKYNFYTINDRYQFRYYQTYQNRIYSLSVRMPMNLTRYTDICEDLGGYVAEINDQAEFEFLQGYITHSYKNDVPVMIAGTDEGHEGTWTYPSSGNSLSFAKWRDGSPSTSTTRNCIYYFPSTQLMHDSVCFYDLPGYTRMVLCEIEY